MNNICKKNADNNYDIPEYSTFFSYIENDIEETRMLVNALKISDEIVRIKYDYENTELEKLQNIQIHIDEQFKELESVYGAS